MVHCKVRVGREQRDGPRLHVLFGQGVTVGEDLRAAAHHGVRVQVRGLHLEHLQIRVNGQRSTVNGQRSADNGEVRVWGEVWGVG